MADKYRTNASSPAIDFWTKSKQPATDSSCNENFYELVFSSSPSFDVCFALQKVTKAQSKRMIYDFFPSKQRNRKCIECMRRGQQKELHKRNTIWTKCKSFPISLIILSFGKLKSGKPIAEMFFISIRLFSFLENCKFSSRYDWIVVVDNNMRFMFMFNCSCLMSDVKQLHKIVERGEKSRENYKHYDVLMCCCSIWNIPEIYFRNFNNTQLPSFYCSMPTLLEPTCRVEKEIQTDFNRLNWHSVHQFKLRAYGRLFLYRTHGDFNTILSKMVNNIQLRCNIYNDRLISTCSEYLLAISMHRLSNKSIRCDARQYCIYNRYLLIVHISDWCKRLWHKTTYNIIIIIVFELIPPAPLN